MALFTLLIMSAVVLSAGSTPLANSPHLHYSKNDVPRPQITQKEAI